MKKWMRVGMGTLSFGLVLAFGLGLYSNREQAYAEDAKVLEQRLKAAERVKEVSSAPSSPVVEQIEPDRVVRVILYKKRPDTAPSLTRLSLETLHGSRFWFTVTNEEAKKYKLQDVLWVGVKYGEGWTGGPSRDIVGGRVMTAAEVDAWKKARWEKTQAEKALVPPKGEPAVKK